MKSNLFGRIFVLHVLLLVVALAFIEFYITSIVREDHIENLRKSLAHQAALASETIAGYEGDLDAFTRRLKEKTGARVTVILPDGRVIGDSDSESAAMENHAGRPEIKMAAYSGTGWAIRHSETIKHELLYFALKVEREGEARGFVRLSVPLLEVERSVGLLRVKLSFAVAFVLLSTGLFSLWQTGRLRRLTGQIADFSHSIASGDFNRRLFSEGMGEFDEIAGDLNKMSADLKALASANEAELKRLNTILQSIPDALLIIDLKGVIVASNGVAEEFFGLGLAGRAASEVVRSPEFFSTLNAVRGDMAGHTAEFEMEHPPEMERHFTLNIRPLFLEEGRLSGFIAVLHDITRLRRLEEARKDFVANVSHEIKTPVAAIRGFAETLMEGAIEDRENAMKFLNTIKSNSVRINSLVDDLMTISRIELGVIRVEKTEVDVKDVMEGVVMDLKEKADRKKLEIKTSIDPGASKIRADRLRLAQILTNLLDNAVKFTDSGGVTLGSDMEDGRPVLFVEDTGIGIPRKHIPRLGERFYRVDPSRSRALGGTGLGLAIVKHLVKAHGWQMKIESSEGKGTKVRILC